MNILTKEKFFNQIENYANSDVLYWKRNLNRAKKRWAYYEPTIQICKNLNPKTVLEAGTMGIKIFEESEVIDYKYTSKYEPIDCTYLHNMKEFPWPIDKTYDLFIATRVFQHLLHKQKECFQEAKRISRNILLAIPIKKETNIPKKIISMDEVIDWNNGIKPTKIIAVPYDNTKVVFWNEETLHKK